MAFTWAKPRMWPVLGIMTLGCMGVPEVGAHPPKLKRLEHQISRFMDVHRKFQSKLQVLKVLMQLVYIPLESWIFVVENLQKCWTHGLRTGYDIVWYGNPGDLRVCDLQWPQAEHWNQWTCVVSLVYFQLFASFKHEVGEHFEFMNFLGLTSMAASPPTPRHRTHWSFHWSRGGVAWNVCLRRISSMEVNHLGNARATTRPQLVTGRMGVWKNWIHMDTWVPPSL